MVQYILIILGNCKTNKENVKNPNLLGYRYIADELHNSPVVV